MSIKNLAKNIKEGSRADTKEVSKEEDLTIEKGSSVKTSVGKKQDTRVPEFFQELKSCLEEKKYNNKATTYIDKEISEVLSVIKSKGKIPISSLLSYIVEDWIKKHKDEIKKLPTNRYLK